MGLGILIPNPTSQKVIQMTNNNQIPMIDGEIFMYFCQLLQRHGMYVDNLESKDVC